MTFGAPMMLWLLPALVLPLAGFFWWAWRTRQRLITQFISTRLLAHLKVGVSATRQKARMAMIVAAVTLLVLTLARPEWGFTQEEAIQRGLDIIMAIDTSNSMLADDVQPNRLARAKLAAMDLAHRAKTDRLGLIAFAGSAFLECPLTLDDAAFSQSVASLDTQTISQGGTAIAEAIDEARQDFKKDSGNHKVLVLFTDGEDQETGAEEAARQAADAGITIFTVGIGTAEGETIKLRDGQGHVDYLKDDDGNMVKSHLNEDLLQQIAHNTKGFYMHLSGSGTMDTLYDRGIAPLPKTENSSRMFQRFHERFYWPLSIAMALLILEMFLPERKKRRRTGTATATATSGTGTAVAVAETAAILLLLAAATTARAGGASQALRDYKAGNYTNALAEYQTLAKVETNDLRLVFNAGAAAYQATNYDEAMKDFTIVAGAQDLKLQQKAYYNLGNTQFRMGQAGKDLDDVQKQWETAVKSYEVAHALDTNDADATFNLDFAKNCVAQIVELRQLALRAKAAADEATRRAEYHRALQIMDDLLQKNPAAKQFQDYEKKLKDIDEIVTPSQH